MPVRSLTSSVVTWPDARAVDTALRQWARAASGAGRGLRRVGYFGSYARGDWGVGSDVDVIVIVRASDQPFPRRAAAWDLTALPVPADVLVYTEEEWAGLPARSRFAQTIAREAIWVYTAVP